MRMFFLLVTMILLPFQAVAQETEIDLKAAEIVTRAAEYLVIQPRFSFNWFVSLDEVRDDSEKVTYIRSGETLMSRGNGFVSHSERDGTLRDFYYDGAEFTVASPNEGFYTNMPFTGGFDSLVDTVREYTGTILPLWSLMSDTLADGLLDDVEKGSYLGETLIAGSPVHHLAFTGENEDWQIWISTDDTRPLPLMIVGTEKNEVGWPQYRVYMTDWNLDPATDQAMFRFVPGENDTRVSMPVQIPPSGDGETTGN